MKDVFWCISRPQWNQNLNIYYYYYHHHPHWYHYHCYHYSSQAEFVTVKFIPSLILYSFLKEKPLENAKRRLPLAEEMGKNHYKPNKFIRIDRRSTEKCLAHRAHVSSKPRDFRGTEKSHAVSRKMEDLLSKVKCPCTHFLIQKLSPCQHLVQLINDFH